MNREELIEEARRAYLDAWAATVLEEVPPGTRSRNGIIAALAVFEKAHAPTDDDDERDSLLDKARKEAEKINQLAEDRFASDETAFGVDEESFVSGANWAFDRSQRTVIRITPEAVQREYDLRNGAAPTDDRREAPAQELCDRCGWALSGRLLSQYGRDCPPGGSRPGFRRTEVPEPQGEPSEDHAYRGNRSQDTCWVDVNGEMCRKPVEAHMEPQGEPTDAQVKAALDEYLRAETGGKVRAMRSALRAAKEAKS